MKSIKKIFAVLGITAFAFGGLLMSSGINVVTAASTACTDLEKQISGSGFNVKDQLPVYCTTESIYNKILFGALYAVGIVAVIMIIYGGYMYMTAQSNEDQRKKGRDILTWAVLGLIVVVLAVLLVNVVVNLVVENRFV